MVVDIPINCCVRLLYLVPILIMTKFIIRRILKFFDEFNIVLYVKLN